MIILFIELLAVSILVMVFTALTLDERKKRSDEMQLVKLKGYWDGGERRSTDRLNIALRVRYATKENTKETQSMDVSSKGVRLLLEERLSKGYPLLLEIKLPDNARLIRIDGAVVWTSEAIEDEKNSQKRLFNTGIQFHRFHGASEKILFDFVHNL